jgi:hypothetical protein
MRKRKIKKEKSTILWGISNVDGLICTSPLCDTKKEALRAADYEAFGDEVVKLRITVIPKRKSARR